MVSVRTIRLYERTKKILDDPNTTCLSFCGQSSCVDTGFGNFPFYLCAVLKMFANECDRLIGFLS